MSARKHVSALKSGTKMPPFFQLRGNPRRDAAFRPRKNFEIAIVNRFDGVSDAEARRVVKALQIQVDRDFAPIWGVRAKLQYVGLKETPDSDTWQLVILNNSDQAGALGYHELTRDGLPLGKIFAGTDIENGLQWSVTAAHELLEMLSDPWINFAMIHQAAGVVYALENCDAVEADRYAYAIEVDGIKVMVSDFVTPDWFIPQWKNFDGPKPKFDFMGHCTEPLQLLPGGYIGVLRSLDGEWEQVIARLPNGDMPTGAQAAPGCRRARRSMGADKWRRSLQ